MKTRQVARARAVRNHAFSVRRSHFASVVQDRTVVWEVRALEVSSQ